MRLLDAARESSEFLERAGIEDPFIDAELLAFHAAGMDRLAAFTENPDIGKDLLRKIRTLTRRRGRGEPVQYIIGHVDFMGLNIQVGRGVLIPRPETELVVREAIETLRNAMPKLRGPALNIPDSINNEARMVNIERASFRILDLCTGTGCIALALAKELPEATVYGTDLSKVAVRYARKNRIVNGINNAEFVSGPLFEPVKAKGKFDLIVSNPPYIKTREIATLQREISEWEPVEALDGGNTGLDFYHIIFSDAGKYLNNRGMVVVELGFGQAEAVTQIARKSGFGNIEIKRDYAGIQRIFKAGKEL